MERIKRSLWIAAFAFLMGCIVDEVKDVEAVSGLSWLYNLRGTIPPPDEIVIVAIDEKSSRDYDIGVLDFARWRKMHTGLIRQLMKQDVALIVFDFYFLSAQPDVDRSLAKSLIDAGNVLAGDCIQTQKNALYECDGKPIDAPIEFNPLTPLLDRALLDHGPYFLEDNGGENVINKSSTFLDASSDYAYSGSS